MLTHSSLNTDLLVILQQCLTIHRVRGDLLNKLIELIEGKPETEFSPDDQAVLHLIRWTHIPTGCMTYAASSGCIVLDVSDTATSQIATGCGTMAIQRKREVTHPTDESLLKHLKYLRDTMPATKPTAQDASP